MGKLERYLSQKEVFASVASHFSGRNLLKNPYIVVFIGMYQYFWNQMNTSYFLSQIRILLMFTVTKINLYEKYEKLNLFGVIYLTRITLKVDRKVVLLWISGRAPSTVIN